MVFLDNNIWAILACPHCVGSLQREDSGVRCVDCGRRFLLSGRNQIDFRLQGERIYNLDFALPGPTLDIEGLFSRKLEFNDCPEVDFSGISAPSHLTPELLSYFPKARNQNSFVLDLGCGNTIHRDVCERTGHTYVGLDYVDPGADMLGDGHALPFQDSSFDFSISIAVLEHIRYPFVMTREAFRVLKPAGVFLGTVAFAEPHHGHSYYHHSHMGLFNSLLSAGFVVQCVAPNTSWNVLFAQRNGLFPKLPRCIYRAMVMPLYLFHRAWWKAIGLATHSSERMEAWRSMRTSGSFCFVASKPAHKVSQ
jgi:SAM-dependent methyltransferase